MSFPTSKPDLSGVYSDNTPQETTHPGIHNTLNEELDAVIDKVGIDSSADTTTHDYKLSGVTGTDKAASITGTETLTGKTLTSPKINENVAVTATATELNIMDGVTATAAELNIMDGVTATAAELNIMDGVTATATELNIMDGVTATTAELNITDGGDTTYKTLATTVAARAYLNNTMENIPNTTFIKVLLDTESHDYGNNFSSYKFTAPVSGLYDIKWKITFVGSSVIANKTYYAYLYKNGTVISREFKHSALVEALSVEGADEFVLTAADYLELYVYLKVGVNTVDVAGGSTYTFLSARLVGV